MQKLKATTQDACLLVENLKKSTHEADLIIKKLSGDKVGDKFGDKVGDKSVSKKPDSKPTKPTASTHGHGHSKPGLPKLERQGSTGSYKGFSRFVGSKKEILKNADGGSRKSGLSETMIKIASNKQIAKPLFEGGPVEKMTPKVSGKTSGSFTGKKLPVRGKKL